MKKPDHLREALVAALDARHDLRRNPDRLHMVASDVRAVAGGRPGSGYQWRYTLILSFLDFAGKPEEITIPLLVWIARHQHDLIANEAKSDQGFTQEIEFLDSNKVDVLIRLQLTEDVNFAPRPGGGHDLVIADEPPPLAFQLDGPPLHVVYLDDQVLVRCSAHPDAG